MDYTGKHYKMFSARFNMNVNVLEYKDKANKPIPWCNCDMCGKPIKSKMYVAQCDDGSDYQDVEMGYFGADCIKKI